MCGFLSSFSLRDVTPLRGEPSVRKGIAVERRPSPAVRRPRFERDRHLLARRPTHLPFGLGAHELRIRLPEAPTNQLARRETRLPEDLRCFRVDVSEPPLDVLHDEGIRDALENSAREPVRAFRRRPRGLRLDERLLESLVGQLELFGELLRLLGLGLELDCLVLKLVVQRVQLSGARFGRLARGELGGESERLLLRRAPFGQVARDLGESHHATLIVTERREDHVRPEARAVLSHAPPSSSNRPSRAAPTSSARGFPARTSSGG